MSPLERMARPEEVAAALGRAGWRPSAAQQLALHRAWPYGRSSLVALFGEPGPPRPDRCWILSHHPAGRIPPRCRRAVERGDAVLLDSLEAVAERFPGDANLPSLREASDPATCAPRLAAWLGGAGLDPASPAVRVAAYKPAHRCMLEYSFERPGGARAQLWGKIYRRGADDAAWAVHVSLQRACRRAGGEAPRLADACGRIPAWSMVLWRHAAGEPLGLASAREHEASAAAAGRSLAALSRLRPMLGRVHGPEAEMETLGRWVRVAGLVFPGHAAMLARAEAEVQRAAARCRRASLRTAHRDFHDGQVRVSSAATTLLDTDTASLAEPELDVGNFLAHMRLRAIQGRCRHPAALSGAFLDAYQSSAGRADRKRLTWYEASALLRIACVYVFRSRWRQLFLPLAEECLSVVQNGCKRVAV